MNINIFLIVHQTVAPQVQSLQVVPVQLHPRDRVVRVLILQVHLVIMKGLDQNEDPDHLLKK